MYAAVRTIGDPALLATALNAAITAVDRYQPTADVATMRQRELVSLSRLRTALMLAGSFALLALALAVVGVYGVLNFDVAERRREFGVRMALGAGPAQLRRMVLVRGLAMTIVGASVGAAGVSILADLLPAAELARGSRWTMTAAGIAVVAVSSVMALWIPARRASAVDPLVALRSD
jgi:ABC-type antimicrobial peptide transport system permease subunit